MALIKLLMSVVVVLMGVLIATSLGSLFILGCAHLLTFVVHLELFQFAVIVAVTAFTAIISYALFDISQAIRKQHEDHNKEWLCENCEDNEHADHDTNGPMDTGQLTQVVGRNHPCSCGSGKKYKLCCLNRPNDHQ